MEEPGMKIVKRDRATNFTTQETRCLINIVVKYGHIIENKQTDAVTWREKEKTWGIIAKEFNAVSGTNSRTEKMLKIKYEGVKRALKKKKAKNRLEQYKTGGGVNEVIPYLDYEKILMKIVLLSVEGLPPRNDSDVHILDVANFNNTEDVENVIPDNEVVVVSEPNEHPINKEFISLEASMPSTSGIQHDHMYEDSVQLTSKWRSWNPNTIKKPKSSKLSNKTFNKETKDMLHDKYSDLAIKRRELIEIQIAVAKKELEVKEKDLQIKEKELEIKEKELQILNLN